MAYLKTYNYSDKKNSTLRLDQCNTQQLSTLLGIYFLYDLTFGVYIQESELCHCQMPLFTAHCQSFKDLSGDDENALQAGQYFMALSCGNLDEDVYTHDIMRGGIYT